MQENDNETNTLTKLKKDNQLVKMLHSDVKFVLLDFLRSPVRKIFKFALEIAQEKVGKFKILKAMV